MLTDMYQEYLYVIGKLKDVWDLEIDVDHRDVHSFYHKKEPVFKLLFGTFVETGESNIVVSFHIKIPVTDAIRWFERIKMIHPLLKVSESHFEDAAGEIYYGEDAEKLVETAFAQQVLDVWLNRASEEEIREFVESEVVGREKDPKKTYNSQQEMEMARMEFERMRKPVEDDEVH